MSTQTHGSQDGRSLRRWGAVLAAGTLALAAGCSGEKQVTTTTTTTTATGASSSAAGATSGAPADAATSTASATGSSPSGSVSGSASSSSSSPAEAGTAEGSAGDPGTGSTSSSSSTGSTSPTSSTDAATDDDGTTSTPAPGGKLPTSADEYADAFVAAWGRGDREGADPYTRGAAAAPLFDEVPKGGSTWRRTASTTKGDVRTVTYTRAGTDETLVVTVDVARAKAGDPEGITTVALS